MERSFTAIVLIGMSGVGKSHWASIYGKGGCVVSADEQIADKISDKMREAGIGGEGEKEKIDRLAAFVGKFGGKKYGGFEYYKFLERQEIYSNAERDSLRDWSQILPNWLGRKGEDDVSLYDTTGSFCEILRDEIHNPYSPSQKLKEHACIVYLACSGEEEEILLKRQLERPKPMVYNRGCFEGWLSDYQRQKSVAEENIDPEDFLRFVFPKAIEPRRARYEEFANVIVATDELEDLLQKNPPPAFTKAFVKFVEDKLSDKGRAPRDFCCR